MPTRRAQRTQALASGTGSSGVRSQSIVGGKTDERLWRSPSEISSPACATDDRRRHRSDRSHDSPRRGQGGRRRRGGGLAGQLAAVPRPGRPSGERQPATAEDLVGDRERRVGRRDPGHGLVVPDRVGGQGVPHHGDGARHEAAVARRRLLQRVHRRDGEAGRLRGGDGEEDLRARHGDARPDHAQLSARLRRSRERKDGLGSRVPRRPPAGRPPSQEQLHLGDAGDRRQGGLRLRRAPRPVGLRSSTASSSGTRRSSRTRCISTSAAAPRRRCGRTASSSSATTRTRASSRRSTPRPARSCGAPTAPRWPRRDVDPAGRRRSSGTTSCGPRWSRSAPASR